MINRLHKQLHCLNDATFHDGVHPSVIGDAEAAQQFVLPSEHKELLKLTNGIEAYGGYVRLFGLDNRAAVDALLWNQNDCWKFAWGNHCWRYWCFAETAWGDQYAYLTDGANAGPVYFLDALSMTAEPISTSFSEFFYKEFIRTAVEPYDKMTVRARKKFGLLEVTSHLVYVPSPLLGGVEDIEHVEKMDARSAMICNGDIARQLDSAPDGARIRSIEHYQDEAGRTRLQLMW